MTSLADIQRGFAQAIDTAAVEVAPFCGRILPGGKLSPLDRLGIYRNSSRGARRDALSDTFPVCRRVLGERCFAGLAAELVASSPSLDGDLNRFGDGFPGFLDARVAGRGPLSELPYLADLARLEWHWHAVYYAPDDRPLDLDDFAAAASGDAAERLRFRLGAALRLLRSDYPVLEIWRAHREGGDTTEVAMGDGDHLVIRRSGLLPVVEPIDRARFELLSALSAERTLGELAAARQAVEHLPDLIGAGWIVDFSLAPRG